MPTAPWPLSVALAAVLAVLAAVSAVTAFRGRTGSLRRGGRLGVRSAPCLASDRAFEVANRVAAPAVLGAAVIAAIGAGLALALFLLTGTLLVVFAVTLVGSTALLVKAGRLEDTAARAVPRPARKPQRGGSCGGCDCAGGGCALSRSVAGATSVTDPRS